LVSPDGFAAICSRVESTRRAGEAGWLHILADHPADWTHPSHLNQSPRPKKSRDFGPMAARFAEHADDRRRELAEILGVSKSSLDELGVGFDVANRCWTFPEKNGIGKVIGIATRDRDGRKRMVKSSRRGLTIPPTFAAETERRTLLLVEGASDVGALLTMSLVAIGRPSNVGGVGYLAEMLSEFVGEIIVIGERDEKSDGRWPGREGAISTATRLSEALGRPIAWAFPSRDAKDSRTWLLKHGNDGPAFLAELETTIIEPPKAEEIYIPPVDNSEPVSLAAWRQALKRSRLESLETPGQYLDTSSTGAGKSFADKAAIRAATSSLIILPTHKNCRELESELQNEGIAAGAFPERTKNNCLNLSKAKVAEAMGLPVMTSVCWSCPFQTKCQYLAGIHAASESPVTISTHERAAKTGLAGLSAGRQFVSIHENATALLRPTTQADDVGLAAVESVLQETLNRPTFLDDSTDEQFTFVSRMLENVSRMRSQFRDVKQTAELELPDGLKKPAGIDGILFVVGQGQPIGQTLRLVMAATVGELSSLSIVVGEHFAKGGEKAEHRHIEAVWTNEPNRNATTWFADATASDELSRLLPGVVDKTPKGRLESVRKTVEVPRDVTIGTAPKTVQNVIRGILADRPHAQRVGIICHQGHKKAIDELEPIFRDRIVKIEHFGSGLDRSTNSWHRECDFLLVVGTPRVPPTAVQSRLVRIGQTEAAAAESGWGPFRWQGRTEAGENVIVESRAYSNPAWQAAHRSIVRSALVQAAGRARPYCEDGIEAVIVSTEEIGQTLSDSTFEPLGRTEAAVLQRIENLMAESPKKTLLEFSASKIGEGLDVKGRTVREALQRLDDRGTIQKRGINKGTMWAIVRRGEGEPESLPVSVCPENDETLKIQGNSGEIAEASGNDEIRPPSRPVKSFRGGGPIEPSGRNGVLLE
jgi:hypothetical protein